MTWLFAFSACYTLGSTYNDGANYILRTVDGGFLVVGYTFSASSGANNDIYIYKLSSSFTHQWSIYIQGPGHESGFYAINTSDGGYLVVGNTNSYGAGGSDVIVIKLTSTGSVSWIRVIGTSGNEHARAAIEVSGNYIIVGTSTSINGRVYIISLSSTGSLNWTRVISASGINLEGFDIIRTSDGGYAIAGSYNRDLYIVKLSSTWSIEWSKTIDHTNYLDMAYDIIQTFDGGYAIAGVCCWGTNDCDACVVRLSSTGTVQFKRAFGRSNVDHGRAIFQTSDGGYIVAGYFSWSDTDKDIWIFKLSSSGTLQWSRTYGSLDSEYGYSLSYTNSLDWVIAGERSNSNIGGFDVFITVIQASDLTLCCSFAYNPSINVYDLGTEGSGGSISTIPSSISTPSPTVFSIGVISTVCTTPVSINESNNFLYCQNKIIVKLDSHSHYANVKIYDISGKLLSKSREFVKDQSIEIDISNIKKGIYVLEIESENQKFKRTFIRRR